MFVAVRLRFAIQSSRFFSLQLSRAFQHLLTPRLPGDRPQNRGSGLTDIPPQGCWGLPTGSPGRWLSQPTWLAWGGSWQRLEGWNPIPLLEMVVILKDIFLPLFSFSEILFYQLFPF